MMLWPLVKLTLNLSIVSFVLNFAAVEGHAQEQEAPKLNPKIVKLNPLEILIPESDFKPILTARFEEIESTEYLIENTTLRIADTSYELKSDGKMVLTTNIAASRESLFFGTILADAQAEIYLDIRIIDWEVQATALGSSIKFSNDLIDSAFQLIRPVVEELILTELQTALNDLNKPIATDSRLALFLKERRILSGSLEVDGFRLFLKRR